jgi:hypothetical protein
VWEPKDFRTIDNCLIALADKGTYVVAYPALLENHLKLEIKQNKPQVSYIVRTIKNCLRPVKRYLVKKLTK